MLTLSHGASAAGNSLKLAGPTSNKLGTNFNFLVTGSASAPANHVVAFEQVDKVNGCASTFAAEAVRLIIENSTYGVYLWDNVAASGTYSVTARFGADHPGVHGICAYLINLSTGTTYANAGVFWTNHS
ncbi:MAG: hypothetical protein ACRDV0_04960 [Acidimicrobiales bacterium]